LLAVELQALVDLDFGVEVTGFSLAEVDVVLEEAQNCRTDRYCEAADETPRLPELASATSRPGDLWLLDRHRLLCGDARSRESFDRLLEGERMDLVLTDPPYNVPIDGHVCGLGRIRHREFAMGAGEMSRAEFTAFLQLTLGHAALACRDGAIAFVCMDWRHLGELLAAGEAVFSELKNICVWNKSNGGMGSFYRSKHELVFVFKVGAAPHTNTVGLGDTGRYRTNVWDYAGVNSLRSGRAEELAMHPTVKPVALLADAIMDCTRRDEIVLDPFAGSGSTLIAAHKTGRRARLIGYDPAYCDQILRRFQQATGKQPRLAATGQAFEIVAESRADGLPTDPIKRQLA
jgi:DNA modification methylase